VQKEYDCNNDKMDEYLVEVRRMKKFFDGFEVLYVPRPNNHDADHLAWITFSRAPTPSDVIMVKLSKPSVKLAEPISEVNLIIIDGPNQERLFGWMNPIRMFLCNQPLSDDNAKVEHIACKAKMYHLTDRELYRQGTNGMMMRCISREEVIQLLQNIHSSVCRSHSSWCSIIGKVFMHSFYWTTAKDDAIEVVTKCNDCRFFQKQTTKHTNTLRPINIFWPFAIWEIDIMGILPRAPGGFKFLFVVIDMFTKWMEPMPVMNITQEAATKFMQSITYRFDVPQRVLTDNGTQFK
jgi:hypothetical protein